MRDPPAVAWTYKLRAALCLVLAVATIGAFVAFLAAWLREPSRWSLGDVKLGTALFLAIAIFFVLEAARMVRPDFLSAAPGRRDWLGERPWALNLAALVIGVPALLVMNPTPHSLLAAAGLAVLTFAVFLLPSVLLHELGHAAGAWAVGLRLEGLAAGPLLLSWFADGRLRLRWTRTRGALGMTHAYPADGVDRPAARAAMILGGPAANAVTALALGGAAIALRQPSLVGADGPGLLLWLAAWHNVYLAVANLLPWTRRGHATDGALLLAMFRAPATEAARLIKQVLLLPPSTRPRDWPITDADLRAARSTDPDLANTCALLAACAASDRGDAATARELLADALSAGDESPHASELRLQRVLLAALIDRDPETARAELLQVVPERHAPGYSLLAEAAVEVAVGRAAEARAALLRWREAAEHVFGGTRWHNGNEWAIDAIEARLANG